MPGLESFPPNVLDLTTHDGSRQKEIRDRLEGLEAMRIETRPELSEVEAEELVADLWLRSLVDDAVQYGKREAF